jgi:NlpC/P60 family
MAATPAGGGGVGVAASSVVAEVEKFVGSPYVYGAAGPSAFDCSGLVQYVLTQLGVPSVPRTSEEQWAWVQHIDASQLQPGDLVFAQFPGDNASPGHVGIYTGNGQVLSAQDPALGVGYSTLASWGGNIVGYGQPPGVGGAGAQAVTTGASGAAGGAAIPSNLLSGAGNLVHALAVVLDRAFALFAPGQGWRITFAVAAIILAVLSYRTLGGPIPIGGAA